MSNYLSPLNTKLDSEQVLKRSYDETKNRIRVDAEVTATIGAVDVIIDAASGDNIKISDGVDILLINADGSINTNVSVSHTDDSIRLGDGTSLITSTTIGPKQGLDVNVINSVSSAGTLVNTFNSISSVSSGSLITIATRTITQNSVLKKCSASGENIAKFEVVLNGSVISSKRTYFGNSLNVDFEFDDGIQLINTDIILIRVIHNRPSVSDFNANIITKEGI